MAKSPNPLGPPQTGFKKFLAGFGYASLGLRFAWQTQCNVRVHMALASVAIIAAVLLRMSRVEIAIILLTIAIVLAAELFNTAIETCIDLVSPEYHTLAKITKDVSAAAVLVCAFFAVIVGVLLFTPAIWQALNT